MTAPARLRTSLAVGVVALCATAAAALPSHAVAPADVAPRVSAAAVAPNVTGAAAHLVAVGDIARLSGGQSLTARIVALRAPDRLLALGDLAYSSGSPTEFAQLYDPAYGRFRSITWPVPGNHEYGTAEAAGFRSYFGITAATWWARTAGLWLVVGLDSERAGDAGQLAFLRRTLAAHDGSPTVVLWHRPRFSLGLHGDAVDTQPLWSVIGADRDVRIVLWGHDHDYERLAIPAPGRTVQAFVVGTGGAELRPFSTRTRSATRKRIADTYGVLDLRLGATGWSWAFITTGRVVADHGSRPL